MDMITIAALGLIPFAFAFLWTALHLAKGDAQAFRQAKDSHRSMLDALFGRAIDRRPCRPDPLLNEGLVRKYKDGKPTWHLNYRMSDETYHRLTR